MPTLSRAVNDFLLKLGSDGVKQTTLVWYSNKLVAMLREVDDLSIDAINNNLMRSYIAKNLYGRDYKLVGDHHNKTQVKGALSPAYIRGHIRALKMFWSWATSEYELRRSPMDGVAMPRNATPIPKAIKDESARALLDTCDNSPRGKRDRAIIMLLLDTGARAAGIRQLSLADIR